MTELSDTGGTPSEWPDQSGSDLSSAGYSYDAANGKITVTGTLPSGTYQVLLQLGSTGETYSEILNIFDNLETTGLISHPLVSVTFNSNGGDGGVMDDIKIPYGTLLPTNAFTKTGFAFQRWTTEPSDLATLPYNKYNNGAAFYPPPSTSITLYAQWTPLIYTFSNAGATGRFGPSQGQLNTAYSGTSLEGSVTSTTNNGTPGIQTWVVPTTGNYVIEAYGAQGAVYDSNYGRGAVIKGVVALTAGDKLWILVGQQGTAGSNGVANYGSGGGGGGSFVGMGTALGSTTALMVAGGGGASGDAGLNSLSHGSISTSGNSGGAPSSDGDTANNAGGTGGGVGSSGGNQTGYPAGTNMDGASGWSGSGTSSQSFQSGGAGTSSSGAGSQNGDGGFGGGGGPHFQVAGGLSEAGGGGGYSGGGAQDGANGSMFWGGGGGSYNSGTDQVNTAGSNAGMGKVIIYLQ